MFGRITTLRKGHLVLTCAALGAMLLWIFLWVFVGLLSGDDAHALQSVLMPLGPLASPPAATAGVLGILYGMVQVCLLAPVLEEICFRWVFCAVAYDAQGKPRGNWSLPVVVLGCGALFGAAHGFRYGFSYEMVIRMGMLGGILAVLYVTLKRRGASALIALGCCIFAHGAYNFSVTATQVAAMRAAKQGYQKGVEETAEACKEFIIKLVATHGDHKAAPAAPAPAPEPDASTFLTPPAK